jgi:pimeloyl-ACP methyl ester carboxylesterase
MLKSYMHKRERHFAMLNDNRIVRPFEWGPEYIKEYIDEFHAVGSEGASSNGNSNGGWPGDVFRAHTEWALAEDSKFFELAEIDGFALNDGILTWPSAVKTPAPENNIARAAYFPHEEKRAAVVVLPHWNAQAGSYFDLCKIMNRVGLGTLRLTMPYHEERMPPELERADFLVSSNVGRTLQSVRQAVLDTRSAVRWLKQQGYEKVGIVGTSIGSCTAFLAAVHDPGIDAAVFNHVSGYFADVVWHGLSTYHVREGLEKAVTLDELRRYWLPISPLAHLDKLKRQPPRPMRFIYTLYDLTFPLDLSYQVKDAFANIGYPAKFSWLPCGHYTLGETPWKFLDGWKIVSFLRSNLR